MHVALRGRGCAEGAKSGAKCDEGVAFLFLGLLTREKKGKKGENRREKNASMGMHHFWTKNHGKKVMMEAPRDRVFELTLAGKSSRHFA